MSIERNAHSMAWRLWILLPALLVLILAAASRADPLPPAPDYRGDIRRGPDGRLIAVPRAPPEESQAADGAKPSSQRILRVGPGGSVASIVEAARIARDGDVIEISAGTYRGQAVVWTQTRLTLRGVGGRPVLQADGANAEGKALWVFRQGEFDVENLEFRGNRVPDGNGAGIRFERGILRIRDCAFFDNEMGVLTANTPDAILEISGSEFGAAPRHTGLLHHLLYVGAIARFTLTGSRFSGGYRGHLVKSRARENLVTYNVIVDGPNGQASYELEFPNGGTAYVIGNLIGQSALTDNPTVVSFGAEGPRWPRNALYLSHNTLLSDHQGGRFLQVWTDKLGPSTEVWMVNNLSAGFASLDPLPNGRFEGNLTIPRASLLPWEGIPARLPIDSPLRGSVRPPGMAEGFPLAPTAEFVFPAGTRPIALPSRLAPGAFQ